MYGAQEFRTTTGRDQKNSTLLREWKKFHLNGSWEETEGGARRKSSKSNDLSAGHGNGESNLDSHIAVNVLYL